MAGQVDVLITMLPNSPDVELVALGRDGLIEGVKPGLLYLDMSTISPLVSQKVGKALGAKGVRMLDAPVSGGEKGAIDAALSIMVGVSRPTSTRRSRCFRPWARPSRIWVPWARAVSPSWPTRSSSP